MGEKPTQSRRPYLIRAMHEWMVDNGQTPHLVIDASIQGVDVPRKYVEDGKIILNVGTDATRSLRLGNDFVEFEARFGGAPQQVRVPMHAVLGIYARETGQGMLFTEPEPGASDKPAADGPSSKTKPPHLKIIK
ncbi:MAG: ClpXP protease specificity-enhancing factor [Gammaproteobacteria bacterium]|nr:ClpXP protease specificity-enhancing factor [Gammaproteobacteria bacterium]